MWSIRRMRPSPKSGEGMLLTCSLQMRHWHCTSMVNDKHPITSQAVTLQLCDCCFRTSALGPKAPWTQGRIGRTATFKMGFTRVRSRAQGLGNEVENAPGSAPGWESP